ncbi:hypothetical protein OH77DRAFT_160371 [Trametes cingulata]|nr:hypothetical protein OH77DRAFT_160371 [Trametes cingulata]
MRQRMLWVGYLREDGPEQDGLSRSTHAKTKMENDTKRATRTTKQNSCKSVLLGWCDRTTPGETRQRKPRTRMGSEGEQTSKGRRAIPIHRMYRSLKRWGSKTRLVGGRRRMPRGAPERREEGPWCPARCGSNTDMIHCGVSHILMRWGRARVRSIPMMWATG